MRNTDPFVWFREHSDALFRWLGFIGLAVLCFVLLRYWALRWGGWRAWAARLARELALTAAAFADPLRSWLRHRSALRLLARRLREPTTWQDAERALAAARAGDLPGRPYAVLVGARTVTVLLAGRAAPEPWTVARAELPPVTPQAAGARPIVVALGTQRGGGEQQCAFLDLSVGPPVLSAAGDEKASRALLQALAAQLDARLPRSLVVVAEGVHRRHPGQPVRTAYRTARDTRHPLGLAPVLVTTALPDPLPPELAAPPGAEPALRVLVLGEARGYARLLVTERHGRVAVMGTPLLPRCDGLGRAVARVLDTLPPVPVPATATDAAAGLLEAGDLFEEEAEDERATAREQQPSAAGAGRRAPGGAAEQSAPTRTSPRTTEPAPAAKRTAT
ncbi:hypothetical protein [Streptomyces shenzhenensis]|uniref:Uncharacterized protein n=1 Tax=Streptomyces shenzhenensis TaxID=943815 RepID=A0A3M0IMY7_9ACTN|nr:hypothetical protein [Streptomyces shenzhenensis]RMB83436.1 hypothetical protein CTZ28_24075 [Streptomyces shenzhenensis]